MFIISKCYITITEKIARRVFSTSMFASLIRALNILLRSSKNFRGDNILRVSVIAKRTGEFFLTGKTNGPMTQKAERTGLLFNC